MLRGRSLATPSAVLSRDGFVRRPLCAWKGSPANASPHKLGALIYVRCLIPARRRCAAHCWGRVAEAAMLRRKYAVVRGAARASAGESATRGVS